VKKKLSAQDQEVVTQNLMSSVSELELMESASSLISSITQLTGIITIPRHEQVTLRHVEFLPLSQNRVLVILVLNEQEVQNLIIQTDREYSDSELTQAANYLTAHYTGKSLIEIRHALVNEMRIDHKSIDHIMHAVFDTAEKTVQKNQEDYILAGESNLLNIAEETGVARLRQLFDAFNSKHDLLHLLDKCLKAEGVQIFIGHESGNQVFDNCSLITAPYSINDKVLGVLGVIGPTRMDYERAITAVDMTAKLLSAVLKERVTIHC
jgi:heat-inducible transcriptional repressor